MTRPASDLDGFRLWPGLLDRAAQEALRDAVRRNVYGTASPREDEVAAMAAYLRQVRAALTELPFGDLCAARLGLPEPMPPAT